MTPPTVGTVTLQPITAQGFRDVTIPAPKKGRRGEVNGPQWPTARKQGRVSVCGVVSYLAFLCPPFPPSCPPLPSPFPPSFSQPFTQRASPGLGSQYCGPGRKINTQWAKPINFPHGACVFQSEPKIPRRTEEERCCRDISLAY